MINKYIFFIKIVFIIFLITSSQEPVFCQPKRIPIDDLPGITLKGYVTCNGVGIPQVVVSDGKNFTQTDAQGIYRLARDPGAMHVFISSPAGYTVPVVNSVPQFYALINQQLSVDQKDFELIQLTRDDTQHTFLAIGDPQILRDSEVPMLRSMVQDMKEWLTEQESNTPVHSIIVGDLVFDQPKYHDTSKEIFSQLNCPVYYAIGNHDHVFSTSQSALQANDLLADSVYKRHYGPTYYSYNRGQVHYVILDDIEYWGGANKKYVNTITAKQLEWLQKDLSYIPKSKSVVVALHAPTKRRVGNGINNSAQLYALLSGYTNVQILSGHTHWNSVVANDGSGIIEHIIGTACGNFWQPEMFCGDGTPAGYKIFHVNGTNFEWFYKTPGRALQFQLRAYTPDSKRISGMYPKDVLVNVWDWDPSWQVEYSENEGVEYKPMIKAMAYDPYAYSVYGAEGDDTFPASRTWIEANPTDHIFHFTPTISNNIVKIRATSRFGQKYTTSVNVIATGIESQEVQKKLKAFPNPVTGGVLKLSGSSPEAGICTIEIFNIYGNSVYQERFQAEGNIEKELQIQALTPGLYNLTIRYGNGSRETLKIIVKK